MQAEPLATLIGIEEIGEVLEMPPALARSYLAGRNEPPVATYHGRPLWLADTVHDIVAAV